LLFTVTDTFSVAGRGVVLLPGLEPIGEERFIVGDPLILKRPDSADDIVRIGGLEFVKSLNAKCLLAIMLSETSKQDVPIGTEVWSVDRS
jgi:hypothetical protein